MASAGNVAAWVSAGVERFEWRCWDGGAVVYMLATGATHEVGDAASVVLGALLARPGVALTEPQLLAALDGDVDSKAIGELSGKPDDDGAAAEYEQDLHALRQLLGQMAQMGLVERRLPAP